MAKPIVFARMPKHDIELLKRVSKARGEDLSDFVRRAIYRELGSLSFLSDEQKKALGIAKSRNQTEEGSPL